MLLNWFLGAIGAIRIHSRKMNTSLNLWGSFNIALKFLKTLLPIHFPNFHSLQCLEPGSNSLLPFQTSHYLSLPRLNEQATRQIAGEGHGSRSPAWSSSEFHKNTETWNFTRYKDLLLKGDNLIILLVAVVDHHVLRMFFATSISIFNPTQVSVLVTLETQSWCYVHDPRRKNCSKGQYQKTCKTFTFHIAKSWDVGNHTRTYMHQQTHVRLRHRRAEKSSS